jgi:hypothetical protein
MNVSKYYNFLDGSNLCNIFASLVVNKINESFPNAKTEISVVNVRNFFIVRGKSSSDKPLMIADIFQEFVSIYDKELSKTIRVIDIIHYGVEFTDELVSVNYHLNKTFNGNSIDIQSFINSHAKNGTYFNMELDKINDIIYYDCLNEDEETIVTILKEKFKSSTLFKSNFSQEIYYSEKFYGLSNNGEKLYHMLIKHIFENISMVGITKELDIKIVSDVNISEIDNENIKLYIYNNNHIVKTSWLESLILDVFPFTENELSSIYLSSEINHIDDIINGEVNSPWKKLNMINDLILF